VFPIEIPLANWLKKPRTQHFLRSFLITARIVIKAEIFVAGAAFVNFGKIANRG